MKTVGRNSGFCYGYLTPLQVQRVVFFEYFILPYFFL